ncbi:ABC-type nitrate/sulfonate/bicarbonate transport system substrate-binding protein [Bosea sp. AK1]|uniref:ABC transporter substrate-binding protein n=1 Tax=Bosea sp. AK1 TaxID=2587160 RepID=UPI001167778F|nr:ABC transporter substrate-binding protein [Bosea sp. AK1]TQI65348.1 ABC-type nitrate/sulfonate/bicarbonate transport system substrate-binding protein [Bosea sp. AK1]
MTDRIHLGIVVPAFFYLPFWAGVSEGFYAAEGLDVEIEVFGGIDPLTEALKEGRVDIAVGSPEHVIHDVEVGGSLRMIGGNVNRPTHDLIAQPAIKTLEDLKGKLIGVSSLSGGTSSLFIEILEKEAGLRYGTDYRMEPAGVVPPRHEKLLAGTIDACMQTDPHNYMAEDAGFSNLGPVKQWIPYFQFTSINVRQDWGDRFRDKVERFLAASIRASAWMAENEDAAVSLATERMEVEERYARKAWHDHVDGDALPLDLRLEPRAIETELDMIRRDRNAAFSIAPDSTWRKYVDESFLAAVRERFPELRKAG